MTPLLPPDTAPTPDSPEALLDWRRRAFDTLVRATFLVLTAAFVFVLRDELSQPQHSILIYLLPSWVVIGMAAFARRLPLGLRQAVVIVAFLVAFAANTYRLGFSVPNGFVAAAMLVLLAALFLERRGAWVVWSATVAIAIGGAYLHTQGHGPPDFEVPQMDLQTPMNWLRIIVIYGVISAAATLGLTSLTERLTTAGRLSETMLTTVEAQGKERVASAQQVAELERHLREAQRREAVGTLAGSVAHDFNNLLVVILNNADELQYRLREPELRSASAAIVDSGRKAAELSRRLLDYSRARAPGNRELDVRDGTQRALELIGRLLPATVSVRADVASNLPRVWGPPSAIEQILVNLCLNGAEAMPDGGTLRVSVDWADPADPADPVDPVDPEQGPGDQLCIRVEDAGGGMPSETMLRAFEPLFSTKDRSTHAGLGLSIVADLAERAGGGVSCRRLGEGMRFEVHLATVENAGGEAIGPAARPASPGGPGGPRGPARAMVDLVGYDPLASPAGAWAAGRRSNPITSDCSR